MLAAAQKNYENLDDNEAVISASDWTTTTQAPTRKHAKLLCRVQLLAVT